MRIVILNIIRFAFLVALQIFVVNQVTLGFLDSYIYLSVYISLLLTFPMNVSKYITMVVALLLGITIDMFQNTDGIHASACLVIGLARPWFIQRFKSDSPIEDITELTVYTEDLQKYVFYCLSLSLLFFFWIFLLEEFSFKSIPLILLKTVLSALFSTLLIIIGQYLLFRKPKNS